jgi:hypothetical protein
MPLSPVRFLQRQWNLQPVSGLVGTVREGATPHGAEKEALWVLPKKMGRKERQAEQRGEKEAKRTAHMCLGILILIGGLEAAKRV